MPHYSVCDLDRFHCISLWLLFSSLIMLNYING